MKHYTVTLPVVGSIMVFVEAESDEHAIEVALDKQNWRVVTGPNTEAGEEWSAMRSIGRGNINYAPVSEVSVECDE